MSIGPEYPGEYFYVEGLIVAIDDELETFAIRTDSGAHYLRWMGNDYSALGAAADSDFIDEGDRVGFSTNAAEQVEARRSIA